MSGFKVGTRSKNRLEPNNLLGLTGGAGVRPRFHEPKAAPVLLRDRFGRCGFLQASRDFISRPTRRPALHQENFATARKRLRLTLPSGTSPAPIRERLPSIALAYS